MLTIPRVQHSIHQVTQWLKEHKLFWLLWVGFGLPYFIWWLTMYPGIMTADSLDQWRQALHHTYNDAHPFTSTLYMQAFRWIHDTPAWVSLSQIVTTSGMLAAAFGYARQKRVSNKILIPIGLFFLIWPVYGIYGVTIWKDIMYSIFVAGLSLLCFLLIVDKQYFTKTWPFVLLAIVATAAALWRHNGIIYLVLPFLLLLICNRRAYRYTCLSFGLTILLFGIMHFGVARAFNVQPAPLMAEWLRMKTVAAIYNQPHPDLSAHEKAIFTSIAPEASWRSHYNCIHTDTTAVMVGSTYRPLAYENNVFNSPRKQAAWERAVLTAATHNPRAVIRDHACVAGQLLTSKPGFYKYAEGILVREDLPRVIESPKLHTASIKQTLYKYLVWSTDSHLTNFIFWSSIPAVLVTLSYLAIAFIKRRPATLGLAILALSNPLFVVLIGSSSDYRYIYSLLLTAPLIPIAYAIEAKFSSRPDTSLQAIKWLVTRSKIK